MIATANPIPSLAAAPPHAATSPSLELLEARRARDDLTTLLRREQVAMAEFLTALAGFDRSRGWERLGHASLFAFLHLELGLSNNASFQRMSAARLLQRFPDLIEPLRAGRLCLSSVAELAKVVTDQNRALVAPRFFGLSAREAREVVAELQPQASPPLRTVITRVSQASTGRWPELPAQAPQSPAPPQARPADTYAGSLLTSEVAVTHPVRAVDRRDEVEPLTADLRRLGMTVSKRFLKKLDDARSGLSHSIPRATTEQVLEAALDLLLEKQARARGLVKRPRKVLQTATPTAPLASAPTTAAVPGAASTPATAPAPTSVSTPAPVSAPAPAPAAVPPPASVQVPVQVTATAVAAMAEAGAETPPPDFTPPLHRRADPRKAVPAAVVRAVWQRDGGRCAWPLDGGGVCGSTHRLELDHVVPWACWGGETVDDLRVVCATHNRLAARQAFGERWIARYARSRGRA